MNLWTKLALALVVTGLQGLNNLDPNFEMTTDFYGRDQKYYYGVKLIMGSGTETSNDRISMEINLGYPHVLLGEKHKAKWGVDCQHPEANSCEVTDESEEVLFYNSLQLRCQKAKMYLRIDYRNQLNVTEPLVQKADAQLVVSGNYWPLRNWGVLGLAPQGAFSKFFSSAYSQQASLLLYYKARDKGAESEDMVFSTRIFANPQYNITSVMETYNIPETQPFWIIEGSSEFISKAYSFKKTNICLNSVNDDIIQVVDATDRCDAVKNLICDGKIGPYCTRDNADLHKAPKLSIKLGNTFFEFYPEEYVYFKKDKVADCRFGDINRLRASDTCPHNTELALGRLFFEKFIPVFKYNYSRPAQVVFLNQYYPPYNPYFPEKSWIAVILGIIVALVVIGVIVTFVMQEKRRQDEEYYLNYNDLEEINN